MRTWCAGPLCGSAAGPECRYTVAQHQLKQEDVYFVLDGLPGVDNGPRVHEEWKVFCIADGHGGQRCAQFVKRRLGATLSRLLPSGHPPPAYSAEGPEYAQAVRKALVQAFVALHDEFEAEGCNGSGTTVSVALVCGWLLTVANVGDSEVFLDTKHQIIEMTCSHKLNDNKSEQDRLKSVGVKLDTLCRTKRGPPAPGEQGIGPLRAWPGGIAMSRSLGDVDCGRHVLPVPHIRQVVIPHTGARLVLASDGLWDHMSGVKACKYSRNSIVTQAAKRLIILARSIAGRLSDDTTILVADIMPPGGCDFSSPTADGVGKQMLRSLKNLARRTLSRGWQQWTRTKRSCGYYADVDGMIEYPDIWRKEVLSLSSAPSLPRSDKLDWKRSSQDTSKSSFDGWDLCTLSWDCSIIQDESCISSTVDNDPETEDQNIMDTAQIYADDVRTIFHQKRTAPTPDELPVTLEEDEQTNNESDEFLDPLDSDW